jgi:hypothetical protein
MISESFKGVKYMIQAVPGGERDLSSFSDFPTPTNDLWTLVQDLKEALTQLSLHQKQGRNSPEQETKLQGLVWNMRDKTRTTEYSMPDNFNDAYDLFA